MLGIKLGLGVNSIVRLHISELQALITSLFGASEQGAIYIPRPVVNGEQALFQDSAGTVPVTADGDPVGRMLDQSGNGNHATQSISGSRPVYRTDGTLHWLEFDGVDDLFVTASTAITGISSYTAASAFLTTSLGVQSIFDYDANPPRISQLLRLQESKLSSIYFGDNVINLLGTAVSEDTALVVSIIAGSGFLTSRVNGLNSVSVSVTGNLSSTEQPLSVGGRLKASGITSQHLQGNFYGGVVQETELSSPERVNLEGYLANLAGITL